MSELGFSIPFWAWVLFALVVALFVAVLVLLQKSSKALVDMRRVLLSHKRDGVTLSEEELQKVSSGHRYGNRAAFTFEASLVDATGAALIMSEIAELFHLEPVDVQPQQYGRYYKLRYRKR